MSRRPPGHRQPPLVYVFSVPASGTRWLRYKVLHDTRCHTYHIESQPEDSWTLKAIASGAPIVVAVRHPVLVMISNRNRRRELGSRPTAFHWMPYLVAHYEQVVPFRVDCDPEARQRELDRLEASAGYWAGTVDWTVDDEWRMDDRTGLQRAFLEGRPEPELDELVAGVTSDPLLLPFYAQQGYDLLRAPAAYA